MNKLSGVICGESLARDDLETIYPCGAKLTEALYILATQILRTACIIYWRLGGSQPVPLQALVLDDYYVVVMVTNI